MKNLKSENGSITSLVIVTVLFFVTILSTSYMVVNALRKSQLKSQINAKDVYERDLKRVDEIVAELENRKNKVWPEPKEENETINGEVGNAYNPTIPAAIVKVAGIMNDEDFLADMQGSFKHKFAKKPEVIEGNMKALEMALREIKKIN